MTNYVTVSTTDYRPLTEADYGGNGAVPLPGLLCLRCGVRIYGNDVPIHDDWHAR